MSGAPRPGDFDARPTVPPDEYARAARMVNVGYELIFALAHALLRALAKPDLDVLVVGAGGGMEVATFAPPNPGWSLTGVDPSANMLALAAERVHALGLDGRVTLLRGTVDDLPPATRYDAATCIFVLQFLPDDGTKLALLRAIAGRLRPGAPLLLVDSTRDHLAAFLGAWQAYGEAQGMPPAGMAATLARIGASTTAVAEGRELALLAEAGFGAVTRFYTGLTIHGWIAR